MIFVKIAQRRQKFATAGLTILETALVLAIACAVLSAIWVAIEASWQNHRLYVANQQLLVIVQNIRDQYKNAPQLPGAVAGADITETMDTVNIFPLEMRRCPVAATCATAPFTGGAGHSPIDNSFNNGAVTGSFHVFNLVHTPPYFRVQLLNLDPAPCIKLLMQEPVEDAEMGVVGVGTAMGSAGVMGNLATNPHSVSIDNLGNGYQTPVAGPPATPFPLPLTSIVANTWCGAGAGLNEVDWDFRLR